MRSRVVTRHATFMEYIPCAVGRFWGMVVDSLQVERASHPIGRRRFPLGFKVNGFVRRFRRTLVCTSACVTAGAFLVPATDSIHGETHRAQELVISEPRINDRIRVPEVRLVGPGGEQVGVVRRTRPGRGCPEREAARVQAHGLRQVQVRSRNQGS